MQGADRVNDELEVGFDQVFERGWTYAERVGHFVMAAFLLAGLGGLLGRGPYSHSTERAPGSSLAVDFEPIARSQTATQVTFHLDNPGPDPTLDLFVGNDIVEPMGLTRVLPQPVSTQAVTDGLVLTIAVPPGARDAELRLMLGPVGIGPKHLIARLAGQAPVHWTQLVVP